MPQPEGTSKPIERGWALLRNRDWPGAKAAFGEALGLGAGAEAYEGLSWAAWWLDEGPEVFRSREAAYRLYLERADPRSAARMAVWLAADELDFHGAVPMAQGWLRRARSLLDPLEPGIEHGWLAFHEGYQAAAGGRPEIALEHAGVAIELGRRLGTSDLEMLGLALQGSILVGRARLEEGMGLLDEATTLALASSPEIPISSAWTCCMMVSSCTAVLDFDRASQWCDRIAEFASRYASRWMLAFCRAEYGRVHLWRGQWADAERVLVSSVEDFTASRPAWVEGPLVGLAELRRYQGESSQALALLEKISSNAGLLGRAQLALEQGEVLKAAELAERALRGTPDEMPAYRIPILEVLLSSRLARGEIDQAEAALTLLRSAAEAFGTPLMKAVVDRAEGLVALARKQPNRARELLEDALDTFRRSGARFEVARTQAALASSLMAMERSEAAIEELTSALETLTELGAIVEAERTGRLLERASEAREPPSPLTAREIEVLRLLAEGLTNQAIARRLVVSEHTVHRHVTNILRKLDLPSRTAAAAYAFRSKLSD